MRSKTFLRTMNVFAFLAVVVVNGLANALPLNGVTTGEVSDRFDVFFVPAGYVFSIWGLIYLALGAFALVQALPSQRENPMIERIGYTFILSSAANIAWIFFWHYQLLPFTILAMGLLLISLIVIYLRLEIGIRRTAPLDRRLIQIPFQLYLGWITVATIANVTSVLSYMGWNGWGVADETWALIMLTVAAIVAGLVSFTRADASFVLVIIWAYSGIAVKHMDTRLVFLAAAGWGALLAIFMVYNALRKRRRTRIFS